MEQKRQYNMDLLRIFACFMVIVLHVSGQNLGSISPASVDWQIFNVFEVLVRCSVPLFFMISGKLFLSRDDISIKRLFSKNILKLTLVYFIWSFLYAVDTVGVGNIIASPDISLLFSATVASKYHLWYLPSMVSVYLVIPVFIAVKSYKNGKVLDYVALLFFIFSIVRQSILLLPMDPAFAGLLNKFNFIFGVPSGYFLLGHLLDKYKEKLKKIPSYVLILAFLAITAATAAGSFFLSAEAGTSVSPLYDDYFISTFLEAAIIFLLFLRLSELKIHKTAEKIIEKLSAYTLFVYLFHPFVLEHLNSWFGLNSLSFSPVISTPVISLITFAICIASAAVISIIPGIRKILF